MDYDSFGVDHRYLQRLEDEIKFLRDEIGSKNKIINILLEESVMHNKQNSLSHGKTFNSYQFTKTSQNHQNSNFPGDQFITPKKHARNKTIVDDNEVDNRFLHKNLYENLTHENNDLNINYDGQKLDDKNITSRTRNRKRHNKASDQTKKNDKNDKRKVVSILGDSIVKELKGYDLSDNDTRVIVKSFPGAKTDCMKHYIKPSLTFKPDLIILHCGTNDLKGNDDSEDIANNIINLAVEISNTTTVAISELVSRNDKFRERVSDVNKCLKKKCSDRNLAYIEHGNIVGGNHLNRSRIHLNTTGSRLLGENFMFNIKN
jgi:hypothetical protein